MWSPVNRRQQRLTAVLVGHSWTLFGDPVIENSTGTLSKRYVTFAVGVILERRVRCRPVDNFDREFRPIVVSDVERMGGTDPKPTPPEEE